MSGQCKSFSRCHSSMHCWPCVPLENCEILLHWFSVSGRQMMKCPYFSSTICRALIVMATLGKFTAFRGYCHTGWERLSFLFPLLCLLTGNCFSFREVYGLYSSGVYDVTCLPHPVNAWQVFGDAVQAVNDWTSPVRNYLHEKRCDIAFRSCKSVIWKDFTHFSWGLGRRHLKQLLTI